MDFKRARNDNQKKLRIRQIMDGANELFKVYDYRDITMEMIASKLDFSRANMARYVTKKEEIFLLLFVEDLKLLTAEIEQTLLREHNKEKDIKEISRLIAEICFQYTNFLKIGAILNTVIELTLSAERLANYKKEIFVFMERLSIVFITYFDFLSPENAGNLLQIVFNYISGLYPVTEMSEVQQEAVKLSGIQYIPKDFVGSTAYFLEVFLNGCKYMNMQ